MDKEEFKELFKEMLESEEILIAPTTKSTGQQIIQVYIDGNLICECQ